MGGGQEGGTSGDNLKAFAFNAGGSGTISSVPTSQSTNTFYYSGPTPSVSANGTSNGIVWAIDNSAYGPAGSFASGPAVLPADDAANLHSELWNSSHKTADKAEHALKIKLHN